MIVVNNYIFGKQYEASNFLNVISNSNPTISTAINQLVSDLKNASLWDRIHCIYPMVGGTSFTHKFNLKNTNLYQINFQGGWVHSSNGALPNGVDTYGDTNFIPNGIMSLNSAGISYYSRTSNTTTPNNSIMGGVGTNGSSIAISSIGATDVYFSVNELVFPLASINNGSLGLITVNRIVSNTCSITIKTVKASIATNTVAVPNRNLYLGANNSTAIQQYSNYQCAYASMQQGFTDTEILAYNTIINNFQTTLGRQV